MNQDKTFLGTEPIGKLLRQLAVPTVIAQLVNMLYNIVDRIYIGHIPGPHRRRRMPAADFNCLRLRGTGGLRRCAPCLYLHGQAGPRHR